jgi:hypothetical protein
MDLLPPLKIEWLYSVQVRPALSETELTVLPLLPVPNSAIKRSGESVVESEQSLLVLETDVAKHELSAVGEAESVCGERIIMESEGDDD